MPTVTVDGNTYEVYDTYAGVDAYLAAAPHATNWRAVLAADRYRAMVGATRVFDRQPWQGSKTSDAQPIAWPRKDVVDRFGQPVAEGSIPADVLSGYAEYVELLLANSKLQAAVGTVSNVRRVKAGPAEVEFFDGRRQSTRFPEAVHQLVGQFLAGAVAGLGITVTGTAEKSAFAEKDYGRTGVGLP